MNLYYQGIPGSYSSIVSKKCINDLSTPIDETIGLNSFESVWEEIMSGNIGVLPVENSYAGNIHTNINSFVRNNAKIIGEISLEIEHALLSKSNNIKNIRKAYSHPQAIYQCHNFLKENNIEGMLFDDTALAAKMVSESDQEDISAIASKYAGELYGLNALGESIQDQKGNTTRFLLVADKDNPSEYDKQINKTTLIFKIKNTAGELCKALSCFANNDVNLMKIDSIPAYANPFEYLFWIDVDGNINNSNVRDSLKKLEKNSISTKVLGTY